MYLVFPKDCILEYLDIDEDEFYEMKDGDIISVILENLPSLVETESVSVYKNRKELESSHLSYDGGCYYVEVSVASYGKVDFKPVMKKL